MSFKPEDFPMCNHPEIRPTNWEQKKPEPARMIGTCPHHDAICPLCGFGWMGYPLCTCNEEMENESTSGID